MLPTVLVSFPNDMPNNILHTNKKFYFWFCQAFLMEKLTRISLDIPKNGRNFMSRLFKLS